ncbi:ABC transporter ATP-binding protein [[Pseudopropionibacterium] massiliense]|uniref:ABC transporter ATP-binding protein n=1 Tax=[Pseudopropionibacterium] massiliense TaxID=2220000 RepID=UPI00102FE0B3|nr:ABC transporter ATP-binding protein [[Pseudopropionibacterium] massiliense]
MTTQEVDRVEPDQHQADPTAENKRKAREGQAAIKRLAAPVRGLQRLGQAFVIASAILTTAPYIALVQLGDLLLAAHETGTAVDADRAWPAIGLLIGAFSTQLLLYFVGLLITHVADLKLRTQLQRGITQRLAQAPLSWFTESTSGLIRKGIQDDAHAVHTVIAHGPVEILNAVVTPLALLCLAFWLDWRLGLLSIATIPLHVATYAVSMKGMPEKTAEMDAKLAKVSSTMAEFVAGISVVKAFGRVGKAHAAYLDSADQFSRFFRAWALPLVSISCISMAWISIPLLLVVNLGGGALLIQAGAVTLPKVLTTTLIALVLPGAVQVVSSISWSYQMAGAAAIRLCTILDTPILPHPETPQTPQGHTVELDHVSFSYGDTLAVDDVSLTLEEGTVTALLGPSGSGKSTLATLIARFADPDSGSIRLGGVDLRQLSEETLYSQVSFVLQDAQLLRATVRDNIALGRPGATLDEVRRAAGMARIDDFVMSLPDGYDTVIGTDTSLSGGQEQRIAIARAILIDAPVLLLDEATAFADPESEAEIQQALTTLVKGRTVLVIAHRPAAIRGAHRIVVMKQGRIKAAGTHEELQGEPHYRALLRQSGDLSDAVPAEEDHR